MKIAREIYDFVTGGSIATPVGLAIALLASRFGPAAFLAAVTATLVAGTLERAR